MNKAKRLIAIMLLALVVCLGTPQAFAGPSETPGLSGPSETPGITVMVEGPSETPGITISVDGPSETPGIMAAILQVLASII
jgi:hypothetical protein